MRKRAIQLYAALAVIALAACAPAPERHESMAEGVEEISHCDQVRIMQEEPSHPLVYERACAAFVSGKDEALRDLLSQYLDLNQETFGGMMVRTLDHEDAIVPLREGEIEVFRRTLRGGVPYRFIGACDNECGDLDLAIETAAGEQVHVDAAVDNFPIADVTPEVDGEYVVTLYVHSCSIEPCYAGLRVLEQRDNWALEPLIATLELTSGAFDDPVLVDVEAGGSVNMQRRQSSCGGFVSERPDVRVFYNAGEQGAAPLVFSLSSAADTTLVINGPDGLWYCDDDGGARGFNPMVSFENAPSGQYDIWAGVYAEENVRHAARLGVSQGMSQ